MEIEKELIRSGAAKEFIDVTGHSEKQQALDTEQQAGQAQQVRKLKSFQNPITRGNITAVYQAVSKTIWSRPQKPPKSGTIVKPR